MSFTDNTTGRTVVETPQHFFDSLNAEFHFTTDVCALSHNAKCAHFYTPEQDGLAQEWQGVCWMNPPYGRGKNGIAKWIKKASEAKATVVCLVPSRTGTSWWHQYVMERAAEVRFVRGRLKFVGEGNSAKFDSAVVIFRGDNQ